MSARELLANAGLRPTPGRVAVLEAVRSARCALSHREIARALPRGGAADRVTIYRILDLLVERGLVARTSGQDRTFRYCPGPGAGRPGHCHFQCLRCGRMRCLEPGQVPLDTGELGRALALEVQGVELRIDGVCARCRGQGEVGAPG